MNPLLLGALGDITTRVGPDATYAPVRTTLFILLLAACGWVLSRRVAGPEAALFMGRLFLAAFALRIIWALFLMEGIPTLIQDHQYLARGFLNDDGMMYDRLAWNGLKVWQRGQNPLPAFWAAPGYVTATMVLYGIFGHNVFVICVANSFVGALIPAFTYTLARAVTERREARLAAMLCAFFPELVMWSGAHMKDVSVAFCFIVGLWTVLRLADAGKRAPAYVALLVACAVWLSLTRFYYVPMLGLALFLHSRARGHRISVMSLALRGAVVAGLLVMMVTLFERFLPLAVRWASDPLTMISGFYGNMVQARDEGSLFGLLQPPLDLLLLPLAVVFVLLMPFIMWTFVQPDPIYYVFFPATLAWYLLLPFGVYGAARVPRQGMGRVLFVMVVMAVVLLALSGSGLSTSGRTRLPILPLVMIYAAVGLRSFRLPRSPVHTVVAVYGMSISVICLVYMLIR